MNCYTYVYALLRSFRTYSVLSSYIPHFPCISVSFYIVFRYIVADYIVFRYNCQPTKNKKRRREKSVVLHRHLPDNLYAFRPVHVIGQRKRIPHDRHRMPGPDPFPFRVFRPVDRIPHLHDIRKRSSVQRAACPDRFLIHFHPPLFLCRDNRSGCLSLHIFLLLSPESGSGLFLR